MVNTENMQKWIDALRSGEYRQTVNYLETPYGDCAIGVACREAIRAGVSIEVYRVYNNDQQQYTLFDGEAHGIPESVRRWLGCDPRSIYIGGGVPVSYANDHGVSFDDIADGLYRQYLKEPKTDG